MLLSSSYRRTGWFLSMLLHFILFLLLIFTGFFSRVYDPQQNDIANVVYVADSNSGSEGESGSASDQTAPAVSDIVLTGEDSERLNYKTSPLQNGSFKYDTAEYKEKGSSQAAPKGQSGSGTDDSNRSSGSAVTKNGGSGGVGGSSGNNAGSTSDSADEDADALVAVIPPSALNAPYPSYPGSMRSSGAEGSVRVLFSIDAGGNIEDVSVDASSGQAAFDQAALSAARQWTFSPARNAHGRAVRCTIKQNFHFNLYD
ncbi:energy transducer TonB [Pectinatus haikarae]|uniref:energy transducer TonB n=1 Tax=Pectinatus haikarae TaxID=349096 RepID=UPI0018C47050|nr:energy transducer TonB [Pectinatus haikarae]